MILLMLAYLMLTVPDGTHTTDPTIKQARQLYAKSITDESACDQIMELAASHPLPELKGFAACARVMKAKHAFLPTTKYQHFVAGKEQLEQLLVKHPYHPELRFMRLTLQTQLPSLLGYNQHIDADVLFLSKQLKQIQDNELRNAISSYISGLKTNTPNP